jgi:hypothetical protein
MQKLTIKEGFLEEKLTIKSGFLSFTRNAATSAKNPRVSGAQRRNGSV